MKKLFTALLLFTVFTAFGQQGLPADCSAHLDRELKQWRQQFARLDPTAFKLSDTARFEQIPYHITEDMQAFYGLYKPILNYSPDRNKFIDIYSYWLGLERKGSRIVVNPEVDQAISLYDVRSKKWTRIFFCGYSICIDEVVWQNNLRFIMTGTTWDNTNGIHPLVMIADIKTQRFLVYTNNTDTATNTDYTRTKLKKYGIVEE